MFMGVSVPGPGSSLVLFCANKERVGASAERLQHSGPPAHEPGVIAEGVRRAPWRDPSLAP
jgi:hypothetical protein